MTNNTQNPVTVIGTGADSKNQVIFTKVVVVFHESYRGPICREIKCSNNQAFKAALRRALNYCKWDRDSIQDILKRIEEDNPKPWAKIETFGLSFGDDESVTVEVCDAVKINTILYVNF